MQSAESVLSLAVRLRLHSDQLQPARPFASAAFTEHKKKISRCKAKFGMKKLTDCHAWPAQRTLCFAIRLFCASSTAVCTCACVAQLVLLSLLLSLPLVGAEGRKKAQADVESIQCDVLSVFTLPYKSALRCNRMQKA